MLTLDPTGRLYPDQRDLSRHAAERHALLSAVPTAEPAPQHRRPRTHWLAPTLAVRLTPTLSFLRRRTS
jgi:hypothetical protein